MNVRSVSPVQNKGLGTSQHPHLVIDPLDDHVKEDEAIDRADDLEDVALGRDVEQQTAKRG